MSLIETFLIEVFHCSFLCYSNSQWVSSNRHYAFHQFLFWDCEHRFCQVEKFCFCWLHQWGMKRTPSAPIRFIFSSKSFFVASFASAKDLVFREFLHHLRHSIDHCGQGEMKMRLILLLLCTERISQLTPASLSSEFWCQVTFSWHGILGSSYTPATIRYEQEIFERNSWWPSFFW